MTEQVQCSNEQPNLETIASTERTADEKRDGLFCLACKEPYSRIEELMYCPEHKEITVHESCVRDGLIKKCTAIGCDEKFIYYLKPKTAEQMTAGIAEKLGENIISDDLQTQYEKGIDELGRRAEEALRHIYAMRYDESITSLMVMGTLCTIDKRELFLEIMSHKDLLLSNNDNCRTYTSSFFVEPITKITYEKKKILWFFTYNCKKITLTQELSVKYFSYPYDYLFDELLERIKRVPLGTAAAVNNIDVLQLICELPNAIEIERKKIKEEQKQKENDTLTQLKKALSK